MANLLKIVGNTTGILGVLICLAAGVVRLTGNYLVFGYEARALFIAGIALMLMACLAKLHQLTAD